MTKEKNNQKIKIIQIAHCSHSYFSNKNEELKPIILNDWFYKTAKQIKKFYSKYGVECWTVEKLNTKEEQFFEFNKKDRGKIKFRIFPTNFSPKYGLDLSFAILRELKKEIRKNKERGIKTIIHLQEYHNLHGLLIISLFGNKKNVKIICQHHGGSWPLRHLRINKNYRLFFIFFILAQVWENIVLKRVPVFFCLTKDEINYLKKIAPKSKIKFQTMGIEDNYFKKVKKSVARRKLKLKKDDKILLYIGRINEVKGIGYLLKAMKKLKLENQNKEKKQTQNIKLKIIGFGAEIEKFKKFVKENKLKNVELLGAIFGDKKMLYLSAANALILPSTKEGAPVTIMEALARNLPVVATDIGGVPLMIENNREGIIIPQKNSDEIVNSIKKILNWKKKNIQKYANKYKWREIIKKTVKEYENE